MEKRITEKLEQALLPSLLVVENQSALHHGHAGDDGSGESHFHIIIQSEGLDGLSRVAKERKIYSVLADEMKLIHALSIAIK
ncbi:MAG: BolA family protein [Alphaproteobacteria bacterium]|nr:BolA family protein [Alphaproteobacteria bacterium]